MGIMGDRQWVLTQAAAASFVTASPLCFLAAGALAPSTCSEDARFEGDDFAATGMFMLRVVVDSIRASTSDTPIGTSGMSELAGGGTP